MRTSGLGGSLRAGLPFLAFLPILALACAEDPQIELPIVGTLGASPSDLEPLLELEIDRDGHVRVSGEEFGSQDDLMGPLFLAAARHRELSHPAQPSLVHLVIHADRAVPMQVVQAVLQAAVHPAVRINRILFAVRDDSGEERTFATYTQKDRGIAKGSPPLLDERRVGLALGTTRDFDPLSLHAALVEVHGKGIPIAAVRAAPAVPLADALSVLDVLVRTGYTNVHFAPSREWKPDESFAARSAELSAARSTMQVRITLDGQRVPAALPDAVPLPPGRNSSEVEGITEPSHYHRLFGFGNLEEED